MTAGIDTSQITPEMLHVPCGFRPWGDNMLVRPLDPPQYSGMIWIPETARQWERFTGRAVVVAAGPGDLMYLDCPSCDGDGQMTVMMDRCTNCGHEYVRLPGLLSEGPVCCGMGGNVVRVLRDQKCRICEGSGKTLQRFPMHAGVGDLIIFDVPRNREVWLEGERFYVLHEEQHVMAVL